MRRLRRHDSIDDMFDQMQKMVNQLQDGKGLGTNIPVDIEEENGTYKITADLPGVQKDEIDLTADKHEINITAESTAEIEEENEKYFRKERTSRTFQRTLSWPTQVDPETINAEYQDGVLTISAEKDEEEGKNIEIQ